MVHGRLENLICESRVNRDAIVKLDMWLGQLPADYTGSISPLVFARQAHIDKKVAAETFNFACRQKVLKLDFEVICPKCGRCVGIFNINDGCRNRDNCTRKATCNGEKANQLRVAYHLNHQMLN